MVQKYISEETLKTEYGHQPIFAPKVLKEA